MCVCSVCVCVRVRVHVCVCEDQSIVCPLCVQVVTLPIGFETTVLSVGT